MNPDFRDMLSALSGAEVDYLVVGAYALAVHGVPRATGGIDLVATGLAALLVRFGAPLGDLTERDLVTPGTVFQIGIAPRRIDILTAIDGVEFDDAWNARHVTRFEGLEVPVLSRQHLVRNKKAAGRPQDLADVARLEDDGG